MNDDTTPRRDDESQYPVASSLGDLLLSGAKMIDSPVSTLIDMVRPPLQQRQEHFIQRLAERLDTLEENQIDTETLASAIAEVQQIVLASRVEKQERLVNATVNSALSRTLSRSDRRRYMGYLGSFSEWHFRILELLRNPPQTNVMSLSALVQERLGAIADDDLTRVWSDLYRERLVNTESPSTMMTSSGVSTKRTTPFGDRFLLFVSRPDSGSSRQPSDGDQANEMAEATLSREVIPYHQPGLFAFCSRDGPTTLLFLRAMLRYRWQVDQTQIWPYRPPGLRSEVSRSPPTAPSRFR